MIAVIAFVAGLLLGSYARGRFAAVGRLVDVLIANDPWDVPIGEEEIAVRDIVPRDHDFNGGAPTAWSDAVPPGGRVCAVPVPGMSYGICGMPVESEPCSEHVPDYEEAGPC